MLTRPAGYEAKAEARKSDAEAENFFRGRGHNAWGRGWGQTVCMSMKTKILF